MCVFRGYIYICGRNRGNLQDRIAGADTGPGSSFWYLRNDFSFSGKAGDTVVRGLVESGLRNLFRMTRMSNTSPAPSPPLADDQQIPEPTPVPVPATTSGAVEGFKVCPGPHHEKPIKQRDPIARSNFSKDRTRRDGHQNWCKNCKITQQRVQRARATAALESKPVDLPPTPAA